MEHDFWHRKWQNNDIAFHEAQGSPFLRKHHHFFSDSAAPRIFVPLCGKTRDIHYLLSQGYEVLGAELSQLAVQQLFDELGERPVVTASGEHMQYSIPGLTVFVGDIFSLSREQVGNITSIYDRAALIALPDVMRARYVEKVLTLTGGARQLLICVDYDQATMPGPPFAISQQAVHSLYDAYYQVELQESEDIQGGLKGKAPASNQVYYLHPERHNQKG